MFKRRLQGSLTIEAAWLMIVLILVIGEIMGVTMECGRKVEQQTQKKIEVIANPVQLKYISLGIETIKEEKNHGKKIPTKPQ